MNSFKPRGLIHILSPFVDHLSRDVKKASVGNCVLRSKLHAKNCSSPIFNDMLHMSFLAGTHVFKAYPAYTTTLRYDSAVNVVRFVRLQ